MEIGDFVLAVGSPFGLRNSVTFGIISAKGRRDLQFGNATVRYQDFLQTDAAINPGNSGGPLCNLRGEVIGINSAIASKSGISERIGFAIPMNMFINVARQLIDTGKVTRAFLGVSLESRYGPAMAAELGLPNPMGTRVLSVIKGTPAEAAGLQAGDVILQIDGERVEDDAPSDQPGQSDRGGQARAAADLPRRQDADDLGGPGRPRQARPRAVRINGEPPGLSRRLRGPDRPRPTGQPPG